MAENYQYRKCAGDIKYRKVSLRDSKVPEYLDFEDGEQTITIQEGVVLEVMNSDGKTRLFYDLAVKRLSFLVDENVITFDGKIPLHRLYIRDRRIPHMLYKVPVDLPKTDDGSWKMLVPDADENTELYGDEYFMTVYHN